MPDVARALEGGAVALGYCDTRKLAEFTYPMMCLGGKALASELSRQGIPFDSALLPSAAAIFPHLQPSIRAIRRSPAGIEVVKRGPLAGISAGPLLPVASFLLLGYRASAMPDSRPPMSMSMPGTSMNNAKSMNNLKQIALTVLTYDSTYGTLPPAYISDKAAGKPLLSWRVAILPFMDQDALFKEFHLNEPWDSEHNKALIARMPAVYRSPSGAAKPGQTRYVTLRHKDSAFPGKDGVRNREITDGTSNTLMAVETDEAHAVTWTKPDDLDFDPQKPGLGLTGQPGGGFIAAFCDGSVRLIRDSTDLATLRNLVNRHDGNYVKLP